MPNIYNLCLRDGIKPPYQSMWPNTFILGFPKCGTTALAELLKQHHDIYVPEKKEPRYFQFLGKKPDATDIVNQYVIWQLEDYNRLYTDKQESITIDASPGYITSKEAIDELVKTACGKKYIIMLRDPIERTHSHFLFAKQKGYENATITFETCLRGRKRENGTYVRDVDYLQDSKYQQHIAYFLSKVNSADVYLCTTEKFQRHQQETLREIVEFLGVSTFEFDTKIGEKAKSGLPSNRYLNTLLVLLKKIKGLFPKKLRKTVLKKGFNAIYNANLVKPEIEKDTLAYLKNELREDVAYLKEIGLDVKYWKNFH